MSIGNAITIGVPRRIEAMKRRAPHTLRTRPDPVLEFIEVNLAEPNDLLAIHGWLEDRYLTDEDEFETFKCFIQREGAVSRFSGRQTTEEPTDQYDVIVPGQLPTTVRPTDLAYDPNNEDPHFYTIMRLGYDRYGYVTHLAMEEFSHRS